MIELCRIFHVEKSILANLGYLIFKLFWGSMPPDPLEDLGPMVKIEKYLHFTVRSLTYTNPYCPPPPPANFETWLVWHFFKLYALICYIKINSVPPLPNYLPCDN